MDPSNPTPAADPANPPADAAAATPPASATPPAAAPADPASLIEGAAPEQPDTRPVLERIPEKYQVKKDDGTIDPDASLAKMLDGHDALQKRLGADKVPASPADYKLAPPTGADGKPVEDVDVEAFAKDPLFQAFAAKAHAAGVTSEQMQLVVGEYLAVLPQVMGATKALSKDEAAAELAKVWPGDAMKSNLQASYKAMKAFGEGIADDQPGSMKRLLDKFGNDPDFAVFAARIGSEVDLGEDTLPAGTSTSADADIEALQKGEAYWNPSHPDHTKVKAQVQAHYAKKFGTTPHR